MAYPTDKLTLVERVPVRLWATARGMQELFGLPERRTLQLARLGACRHVKLSPERQSVHLFNVADMDAYLSEHTGMDMQLEAEG